MLCRCKMFLHSIQLLHMQGSWTQYNAMAVGCDQLPCDIETPVRGFYRTRNHNVSVCM